MGSEKWRSQIIHNLIGHGKKTLDFIEYDGNQWWFVSKKMKTDFKDHFSCQVEKRSQNHLRMGAVRPVKRLLEKSRRDIM